MCGHTLWCIQGHPFCLVWSLVILFSSHALPKVPCRIFLPAWQPVQLLLWLSCHASHLHKAWKFIVICWVRDHISMFGRHPPLYLPRKLFRLGIKHLTRLNMVMNVPLFFILYCQPAKKNWLIPKKQIFNCEIIDTGVAVLHVYQEAWGKINTA
jgi:hypothetical protein